MEGNGENNTTHIQNENLVPLPVCQKKKSGIPVPVRKTACPQRQVLGTVSQFQQNVTHTNTKRRTEQKRPAAKFSNFRKGAGKSAKSDVSCENPPRRPPPVSVERCASDTQASPKACISALQNTPKALAVTPKYLATESSRKMPGKAPSNLISLVEEQQQSSIEFQKDVSALRSILTNTGITVSASGTVSEMFRPQRITEGQGRPVYIPAKHAAQIRNSVYTKQPRMSLTDSCKQYQKFYRQTRGLEEESDSASPVLVRGPPKAVISESPLLKGMKPQKVTGSVYPKWSHPNLFSPLSQQPSSSQLHREMDATDHMDGERDCLGTPKTPLMAFRRVPITPLSARQRNHGGSVSGMPETPSAAYYRVAVTPARRIPVQNSSKTGLKKEPCPLSQRQESIKKRLRWADILGACSPDLQHTEKTTQQGPVINTVPGIVTDIGTTHTAFRQVTQQLDSLIPSLKADPSGQTSSSQPAALNIADPVADDVGIEKSAFLPVRHTAFNLVGSESLLSTNSKSGREPAGPLHTHSIGDGGDSRHAGEVGEEHRKIMVSGFRTQASVKLSSSSFLEAGGSRVPSTTCDSSAAAQTDILARLQMLEEQENYIQNEIQLLKMAMQKEQERGSKVSNASHASAIRGQATHSTSCYSTTLINQNPSSDVTTPPLHILLRGPRFDLPLTCSADAESVSVASPVASRLSGLTSSVAHLSQSSALCNRAFCSKSSLAVVSESSTSADISSSILISCLKTVDSTCSQGGGTSDVLVPKQGTGDGQSGIWPQDNTETLVPKRKFPLQLNGIVSDDKDSGSLLEISVEDETAAEQIRTDTGSSVWFAPQNLSECGKIGEETFTKEDGETFTLSCSNVDDMQVCGLQSPTEQHEAGGLKTAVDRDKISTGEQKPFQADVTLSQSVNVVIKDSENEATQQVKETNLARQDKLLTSLNASSGLFHDRHTARVNPVSVIIKPSVLSPSLHSHYRTGNLQVNPPIWTALALRSAAENNSHQTSSLTEQQVSPTTNTHTSNTSACPLPGEEEAVEGSPHDSISPSSKLVRRDSPSKRASHRGSRQRSVSPGRRWCGSPSRRSPLHGTLRPRQGGLPCSALKMPDVFLEALLEDECALYAGRLQSFFKDLNTVCDRQELPDPVAKILNEGDDMHFIPICDDSVCNRWPAFEDSAFFSYIPV